MIIDQEKEKAYFLTKEQARVRKGVIGDVWYNLWIRLGVEEFEGVCEITVESVGGDTWLDLNADGVVRVEVNSEQVSSEFLRSKLMIKGLVSGENLIKVEYRRKYSKDGYGLHYFKDTDEKVYIYSNFEPFHANKMFPCFDQPDIKAFLTLSVQCPSHYKVISNEYSISSTAIDSETLHIFKETQKLSTYVFALIAGDYYEHIYPLDAHRIPMRIYCRQALSTGLNADLYYKWTVRGFEYYEKLFQLPYPFSKYDQIFVPEYNAGAMENVGCVTYKEDYINAKNSSELCSASMTFLHEMSHMWFGNLVTMKWWDDLWLNESFATYLSYLAVSQCLADDFSEAWILFLRRKSFAYLADQKQTTHSISSNVENTSQTRSIFDSISYGKGAAVIKQIVFLMGIDKFALGVHEYLRENQYKNTECADFINVLAKQKEGLQEWAIDWIQTAGVNTFQIHVDGKSLKVKQICQGTCQKLKQHDFIIEVLKNDGKRIFKEKVCVQDEEVEMNFDNDIGCVIVNSDDHGYMKVIIDKVSLGFITEKLHLISEGVNRMLLISQLSEMINDLTVSAVDYLNILLNHFPNETDITILSYMLSQALVTLQGKIKKKQIKTTFYSLFFDQILKRVHQFPSFQESLISFIFSNDQIAECTKWLSSENPPIELTQSRRWKLLKMYSRISIEAKSLVEQEHDNTSEGILARLYCESVYPDPESKEKAWNMFVSGCIGLSRYQRKSAFSGFMKKSQKNILQNYADLFFEELGRIREKFNFEYLIDFSSLLFPEFKDLEYLREKVQAAIEGFGEEDIQVKKNFMNKMEVLERNHRIKNNA